MKEKRVLKFFENQSLLSECSLPFIYPFKIHQISNNGIMYERSYYSCDLKSIIYSKCLSLSEISSIMIRLSKISMILCECDVNVSNMKSSNIIYENNEVKLVDLCLNELRSPEDMRIDEICYRSPEELNGSESNEKSVVWSVGCMLYEILNKELPFNEENDMNKTLNNIMQCKLNDDIKVDDEMMKQILLFRMLKVENEDRLSLIEFSKEIIKENEILRDSENHIMIIKERKEILFNNDYSIEISPFYIQKDYYLQYNKCEEIRDDLIEKYNNKADERILSIIIIIIMKLYKDDKCIEDKLKYQLHHQCKYRKEECSLDEMIFNTYIKYNNQEIVYIYPPCICFCEEGIKYLFRILKLINSTKLKFDDYNGFSIPIQSQPLFGLCFSQLSNLQKLYLSKCNLTSHFIESFVKSIPSMNKLKYVNLEDNRIGLTGFKLLLPYIHLLINNKNELNLWGMYLNDESMILLSSELYKYLNIKKINIWGNKNIHSIGLKSIFSKFPKSKVEFDFNGSKELLIDKNISELIKYIKYGYELKLNGCGIDDKFLKSFISLRLNELREIRCLDLRNNNLTSESIEILINNLSSLPNLKHLELYGNPIGDVGMKILSQHLYLLEEKYYKFNCSKMGLSSEGLKYLLDVLKNIHEKIWLNISENNIDSSGIEYLKSYMKENVKINTLFIHNNPIGDDGFKLLLDNLNILVSWYELNLSNISIDDESMILLTNKICSIGECKEINLTGNRIRMNGLKSICEKSLKEKYYPFIEMKCLNWTNEELKYYLKYCIKKKRSDDDRKVYDFSSIKFIFVMKIEMNLNDSHISLIKQINYKRLDLSNNKISFKGFKELTEIPYFSEYISIYGNEIGDEGVEIICKYFDKFVERDGYYTPLSLNLSNIGMREKGLKMLIEKLRDYEELKKIDISENELNKEELRLMKKNEEVFCCLEELSLTIKENINRNELKPFLETFSTIDKIKLNGINEEEKKELSKELLNVE